MELIPYTQTTGYSCLPVCLLQCNTGTFSKNDEHALLCRGLINNDHRDYTLGMCEAYTNMYANSVELYVHYKMYVKQLQRYAINNFVTIKHQSIDHNFLKHIALPCIVHVDSFFTIRDRVHASHFVVLTQYDAKKCTYMDPWDGAAHTISIKKLLLAIDGLRIHLHFAPLIIQVQKKP